MRLVKVKLKRRRVDINVKQLDKIVDKTSEALLSDEERGTLKEAIHAMVERLTPGWRTTEKTSKVDPEQPTSVAVTPEAAPKPPKPGHGRNPASAYKGANVVEVPHPDLTPGCRCPDPDCHEGKVYALKEPGQVIRVMSMPPINATRYDFQRLRCAMCWKIYTAPAPEGVGDAKYDESVPSMLAQLKYGSGMPFYRIQGLQQLLGIPMPAAVQWMLLWEAAEQLKPVLAELKRQGAQGEILYHDDTKVRILTTVRAEDDKRTGLFTTGLVSVIEEGLRIALYVSGTQHAGENLADLLLQREEGQKPPIVMADALSRNRPKLSVGMEILFANCLAHGRRHVVDVIESFPDQSRHILEELGEVYGFDEQARQQGLNADQRLAFHQANSEPVMTGLKKWMTAELDEKRIEPNSGLGKAIRYLLKHWEPLTLFLRQPGAPLDNNIAERCLKKAVLHRKNALFYRTLNGAQVGDLFMSIICQWPNCLREIAAI